MVSQSLGGQSEPTWGHAFKEEFQRNCQNHFIGSMGREKDMPGWNPEKNLHAWLTSFVLLKMKVPLCQAHGVAIRPVSDCAFSWKRQPQPYTTFLIAVINLTAVSVTQGETCADDLDPGAWHLPLLCWFVFLADVFKSQEETKDIGYSERCSVKAAPCHFG